MRAGPIKFLSGKKQILLAGRSEGKIIVTFSECLLQEQALWCACAMENKKTHQTRPFREHSSGLKKKIIPSRLRVKWFKENIRPPIWLCLHSLYKLLLWRFLVTLRDSTSLYTVVINGAQAQINASQKGALLRMTGKTEMGLLSFFLKSFPKNDLH